MRLFIKLILFVLFLSVPFHTALANDSPTTKEAKSWKLVWRDEFDGDTLDPSKWKAEDGDLKKNGELQYYTPEDVYVHDGVLTLRSQERPFYGLRYTSGLVDTRGKFSLKYGFVEIRARLPKGQGIWPAHWMMPDDNSWPPEIDIMELLGHLPNQIHMTHHYPLFGQHKSHGKSFTGPDFSKDFHTFGMQWSPTEIRWYVDGKLCFTADKNIPDVPMCIILNTAVGGYWPGYPSKETTFPQHHDIDYVRVFVEDASNK